MLYLISQQTPESAFGKKMALNTRITMVRHQTSDFTLVAYSTIYDGRWKQSGSELSRPGPGARFTKYLTIYRKIIVRSTYDSDLKSAKNFLGIS